MFRLPYIPNLVGFRKYIAFVKSGFKCNEVLIDIEKYGWYD
jgi:hypothetical protein